MEIEAALLLCDAAQVDPAGKLHILGANWSVTTTPTPPQTLVVVLTVPWEHTNNRHEVTARLLDADGHPVQVPGPPAAGSGAADIPGFGQPTWQPLELQHVVEVGRPQGLPPGSEVRVPLLVSLGPGLPLQPGRHVWEIEIDGRRETRWQVGFLVSLPQQPSVPEQQV